MLDSMIYEATVIPVVVLERSECWLCYRMDGST
jgi:hypothetical protein